MICSMEPFLVETLLNKYMDKVAAVVLTLKHIFSNSRWPLLRMAILKNFP